MRMASTHELCNATKFGGTMVTMADTQKTATEKERINPNTDKYEDGFQTSCGQAYIRFDNK